MSIKTITDSKLLPTTKGQIVTLKIEGITYDVTFDCINNKGLSLYNLKPYGKRNKPLSYSLVGVLHHSDRFGSFLNVCNHRFPW